MTDIWPPTTLPGTQSRLVRARANGDAYRVDIAIPAGDVPEGGFPMVCLLDAGGCFATCVDAVRRMARRPDATGVAPLLVVGISSAEAGVYDIARRQRDFTTPPPAAPPPNFGQTGGAAAFHAFLVEEVQPLIAADFPVARDRQTLFGHSLAGYFTLWALAHAPQSWRSYAAISPSLWWDHAGLIGLLARADVSDRKLLLAVGEWEGPLPPWQQQAPHAERVAARRAERNMLASARALAETLRPRFAPGACRYAELADEDHASIVSAAIPRMLRMASQSGDTR